jgi:hypothetical protein
MFTFPAQIPLRMETRLQRGSRMLGSAGALQTAPTLLVTDSTALRARAVVGWRALVAAALLSLVLGVASLACLPATALAAHASIAPFATIQGRPAHSGQGSSRSTSPIVLPRRGANPAAYAREKLKASQLSHTRAAGPATGAQGSASPSGFSSGAAAAVFGSLNATGLSAEAQIAAGGEDTTPPDTTGAIGPNHYVEFVNSEVAAYVRASLAIVGSPVDLSTFTGGVAACDPQIKYDPQTERWFYLAIRCDGTTTTNALYMGFSKTSDPHDLSTAVGHGWCGYSYAFGTVLEDYPKLGLDALHIVIATNSFKSTSPFTFFTAHIFSLPKPVKGAIEACPAAPALSTFGSAGKPLKTSVAEHRASTPEPATVADNSPSGFVVAADEASAFSGEGKNIMIWQVAGTATAPTLTPLGAPTVSEFKLPPNVPQPASTDMIDSSDSRLTQAVAAADPNAGGAETVWTQHTVAGGAGSVVRWYELAPSTVTVKQTGTISDPSNLVFNGAIAPTLSGGAVIDYNTGSSSAVVQLMAQSRIGSAPEGTMNTPITLGSSSAIDSDFSCPSQPLGKQRKTTSCRWGDYAGASVDPSNAKVVWGSSQLNGPTGASTEFGHKAQWVTRNFALEATGPPTVVTGAASAVTQTSATLNATVNPNSGEVSECKFEYGTTTAYGSSAPCSSLPGSGSSPVAVSASVTGLAVNTTYHFRISATNPGGTSKGSDQTFTTLPGPPTVVTGAASAVTQTSATLNATVNPNGGTVSDCHFEYGPTEAYGSTAPCSSLPGSGESPVAVSASVTGLAASTTYHFRISATNAGGTGKGSDQTFTTLAASHYFSGGLGAVARIAPEEKIPVVSWGTLTLTNLKTGSKVTCRDVAGGYVENPAPGGPAGPAGVGETQSFNPYECESEGCTPAATGGGPATYISVEALATEAPFPGTGNETNLGWKSQLLTEGSLTRSQSVGVKINVSCNVNTASNGKGEPIFGVVTEEKLEGSNKPNTVTKCCKASSPPEVEFDAGSGTLHRPAPEEAIEAKTEGNLKILGYNEEELINAKVG